jgi:hypothetical protein
MMKNKEEAALISAICGPVSKDLERIVDGLLKKSTTEAAFTDPAVAVIFQEVIRGYFTPDIISKCLPTINNAQKFQDFERLAMCIVKMYEMMDLILESFRNRHRTKEADIFRELTKNILNRTADSLNEKFYYKTDLHKLIEDIFYELEHVLANQEALRPNLDDQEMEKSRLMKQADFERNLTNRKTIDCGVSRFSDLTGLGLRRLIAKVNSADVAIFDANNYNNDLREMIKHVMHRTDCSRDKFVFFYLNDKRKIKHFDFFKVLLIEIEPNMKVRRSEITHFENNPSSYDKQQVLYKEFFLEDNPSSDLQLDADFINQMEVLFEDEVAVYNIQSKLLLAIYQIIYKQFIVDKLRTDIFKKSAGDVPKIIITVENLYDFFNFLKSGRVGLSAYDPSHMRMLEQGMNSGGLATSVRVNNYISPSALDNQSRYEVHRSLLNTYGSQAKHIDGSNFDPRAQAANVDPRFQDSMRQSRAGPYASTLPDSFLQSVLMSNQRKLEKVREDEERRRAELSRIVEKGDRKMLESQHLYPVEDNSQAKEHMARLQAERLEKEERARQAMLEREEERKRIAEAAREKALKDQRDAEERREKDRQEREERARAYEEERAKKEKERLELEKKRREEQEEKDKKDKEEREKRDLEERRRRDAWEKEEMEKNQAREKAFREQAEKEKQEREERERVLKEKLEKERLEREAKDQADRERRAKEREEQDRLDKARADQAEKDRLERLEKDRAAREQAEKDRQEKEALDRAERQKRDQEEKEKAERERIERDTRDREERERQEKARKEREANEQKEREEREKRDREAREAREQKEREEREAEAERQKREKETREKEAEAERLRRENERLAQEAEQKRKEKEAEEERIRLENEKKAREETLKKQKEEQEKIEAQKRQEEEEKKKKEAANKKDDFDDFDLDGDGFDDIADDFGDLDEDNFGASTEKKTQAKPASKQPSPKAPAKTTAAPPPKETVVKKNDKADEEFEFDDFDDDFLNDDLEESKKSKAKQEPPKKEEPKKAAPVVEEPANETPAFSGGLRGLKKKSDENKVSHQNSRVGASEKVELDNPLGHERVLKSIHLPLIDNYIEATAPMKEEQIQEMMTSLQIDYQTVCLMFNEYVRSQTIFILDYMDTNHMLQIWASAIEDNGRLDMTSIKQLGTMFGQVLQGTFENEPFDKIKYFVVPFIEIEDVAEEGVVQAIVDLKNRQVFFVSLNPEVTEESARAKPEFHMIANILAKSLNVAMTGKDDIDIPTSNIFLPQLHPEVNEFLTVSCEAAPEMDEDGEGEVMGFPYLRLMMITYLMLFENATDQLNFDGFKKSLSIESFDLNNAARFVATMRSTRDAFTLRATLDQQPEIADALLQTAEDMMREHQCFVVVKFPDELTDPSDIEAVIKNDLKQLNDQRKASDKVFAGLAYTCSEVSDQRLYYYLVLQKDAPDLVMYLSINFEALNKKCLDLIEATLTKERGSKPQILYEHQRHSFLIENIDIFTYSWMISVYELNLSPLDALRCLTYNELPIVNELLQGAMAGEDEQNPNDMAIGMEDSAERGVVEDPNADGDDNFDDEFDFEEEFNKAPAKTTAKPVDNKRPTSALPSVGKLPATKPKESNIDYGIDDDFDDDFGNDDDNKGVVDDFDDLDF